MKLHPLSVPYRAASRVVSVAAVAVVGGGVLGDAANLSTPLGAVGLAVLGIAAVVGWEVAYHRRFDYELTADTLDITSGVLSLRHREIPLRRIQNVDIRRTAVQRVLGIAAARFETAGGSETEASLEFVAAAEAKRLQREVQRRKAGATDETGAADPTPEPERTIFELADEDLLALSLVTVDFRAVPVLAVVVPLIASRVPVDPLARALFGVTVVGAVLSLLGLWATSAAVTFVRYFGFRLSTVGEDLRYERGLLQRYDGSIPREKVQTLVVRENVAMRRLGFAALAVETAGYSPGQSPGGGSSVAVPFARREAVLELARSIEPFPDLPFERPPKRARRRYAVRYALLVLALTGVAAALDAFVGHTGLWYAPLALLPLAPVAAHYRWLSLGYALGEDYLVARSGFWRRRTTVVPYYRLQTVVQRASVFQRRLGLATVVADTAGSLSLADSDASAADVDVTTADRLRVEFHRRMQASRRARRTRAAGD